MLSAASCDRGGPVPLEATVVWSSEGGREPFARFGAAVASNPSGALLVGAPTAGGNAGKVFYFRSLSDQPAVLEGEADPRKFEEYFGTAVAFLGDIDGDGRGEVAVGAPGYGPPVNLGRVYLYSLAGARRAGILNGEREGSFFGNALAAAGDVNRDGYADLLVGATNFDGGRGKAYLYCGSPSGLRLCWSAVGERRRENFGAAFAAGDFNGDGRVDLAVGAAFLTGRVAVFDGRDLAGAAAWSSTGPNQGGAKFGAALTVGRFTVGRFDDLLIGAPAYDSGQTDTGAVFLYQGGSGWFSRPSWSSFGEDRHDSFFGTSLAIFDQGIAVGAKGMKVDAPLSGTTYLFDRGRRKPAMVGKIPGEEGSAAGSALAAYPGGIAVGLPHFSEERSGKVMIYRISRRDQK